MADTPKSTHVANGPLWVIALALVTIAGCLVLLVLKSLPRQRIPRQRQKLLKLWKTLLRLNRAPGCSGQTQDEAGPGSGKKASRKFTRTDTP
ncbi:hypothetical protein Cflav_PD1989 [Pedosphaera parvula Ellin514]|uniref:Uncharacterized protein n=1 Tax=Pedosphaera parvula (strain Ellin514) TaxID=320771 RepID=B9XN20_PEDPL|nr:hypothetical protein Cflav_PD1989 [Pedosphaera parvula Ellin514]